MMNPLASSSNGLGNGGGLLTDASGVLPASWDLLLAGIVVGERRTLSLPDCFFDGTALEELWRRSEKERERTKIKTGPQRLELVVKLISLNGE